jgi:hypothetical protein
VTVLPPHHERRGPLGPARLEDLADATRLADVASGDGDPVSDLSVHAHLLATAPIVVLTPLKHKENA